MIWFDVDGARRYLAQCEGSRLPSRKAIYRLVAQGLRVARAEDTSERKDTKGKKRGGSRMFFTPDWIDAFLVSRERHRGRPENNAESGIEELAQPVMVPSPVRRRA